jgi:cytochrome c oxidase assembly protein subunit 15
LIAAVAVQILLGIATIVTGVELWIGVAHQGMAALLLGAIIFAAHRLGERRPDTAGISV